MPTKRTATRCYCPHVITPPPGHFRSNDVQTVWGILRKRCANSMGISTRCRHPFVITPPCYMTSSVKRRSLSRFVVSPPLFYPPPLLPGWMCQVHQLLTMALLSPPSISPPKDKPTPGGKKETSIKSVCYHRGVR